MLLIIIGGKHTNVRISLSSIYRKWKRNPENNVVLLIIELKKIKIKY